MFPARITIVRCVLPCCSSGSGQYLWVGLGGAVWRRKFSVFVGWVFLQEFFMYVGTGTYFGDSHKECVSQGIIPLSPVADYARTLTPQ